ncbi:MAG: DUF362 domain-containing protein [Patescibacteria group bacterium]|nr:DUF362 domain-containing protein [Patescibacteria group bacterium]
MSGNSEHITRRDFIKGGVIGTMGITLTANGLWAITSDAQSTTRSKVVVGRSDTIIGSNNKLDQTTVEKVLNASMMKFTNTASVEAAWKSLFSPKDKVGIKMNVMMTATHDELVAAIVKNLKGIGISDGNIFIWDRDRGGIGEKGVYTRNQSFGYHRNSLSNIIMEHTTALINVPGVKTHWLSGIAVAVKNWVGAVTNINTLDRDVVFVIHKNSCEDIGIIPALPEIKNKSRLVIADAIRPLFHGGPQVNPAYLWQNKEIMIATDPVAIDALCLQKIQERRFKEKGAEWPLSPPPISVAAADKKYNLGVSDLKRIDVVTVEV